MTTVRFAGLTAILVLIVSFHPQLPVTGAARKPTPPPAVQPGVLIFLDVETSGSGFREILDRIGSELKARLLERGIPAPDVFKPDSPSTRRALAERTVNDKDMSRISDPAAVIRLCQGMARRVGLIVRVSRTEGISAEPSSLDTDSIIVDAVGERQDGFAVRVDSSDLLGEAKGKKGAIYSVTARKIAAQAMDRMAQWPSVTDDVRLQKAAERAARAGRKAAEGDFVAAIDEINQAIALAPQEAKYYRMAGDYFAGTGDVNFAIVQYRRALTLNADDAETHMRLARILAQQNDWLEAAREAQRSIVAGSDSAEARKIIAHALLTRRDAVYVTRPEEARQLLDEAVKHLRRAVELQPNDTDLIARIAGLMLESRLYAEAAEQWKQVVKSRPNDPKAREQLAFALFNARKYDQALDEYREAWALQSRPIRLDSDAYKRISTLLDQKTFQVFKDAKTALEDFEGGKINREQATLRFEKTRKDASQVSKMIEDLIPPTPQASFHAHRRLAYTLFDQALSSYLSYLDTADALDRDRGMVMQTQAATEYDIARNRHKG